MQIRKLILIGVVAGSLAACQDAGTKQTVGTLIGAAGGALIGSQIGGGTGRLAAVAIGTLAGAFIGSEVGKSLDRADRIAMQNATQTSLETAPSGQATEWRNPDSGHYGTITPKPAVRSSTGEYCREFQHTVTVDGRTERAYGKACRQPDGSWRITDS